MFFNQGFFFAMMAKKPGFIDKWKELLVDAHYLQTVKACLFPSGKFLLVLLLDSFLLALSRKGKSSAAIRLACFAVRFYLRNLLKSLCCFKAKSPPRKKRDCARQHA